MSTLYQRIISRASTKTKMYLNWGHHQNIHLLPWDLTKTSEFSETPNLAYFYANFSCCTPKKSFRRFFLMSVFFSISTCIIFVNFSLCSDQRCRLGVKISYCQQIKKITEALRLSVWCLSENGRRGVHLASVCRNSQSEACIWQWINTMSHVN